MKAQNGLKLPSELCFGIMNVTKDSYLQNSKVGFLKSGQNAAGICPFFLRCIVSKQKISEKKLVDATSETVSLVWCLLQQ